MTLSTWKKTRVRHLAVLNAVDGKPEPSEFHLTENRKTGVSIDFPVHGTCTPTAVCMGAGSRAAPCYALSGFQGYANPLRCQARNQRLVERLFTAPLWSLRAVADDLYGRLPRNQNWLRWNGSGDLTPGAVRFLNVFTERHPDVAVWVVTRKPVEAGKLKDRASLRLLLSLDHSTPPRTAAALRRLKARIQVGSAKLSWTRVDEEDEIPPDIDIVFNRHNGGHFHGWKHRRVCPATLPTAVHENACDRCRRCFTP